MKKHPSLVIWSVLALTVAGCATTPAPTAAPAPSATRVAMAPAATSTRSEVVVTPTVDEGQAADEQRPTITVNPRLHATDPQTVKLASGDQPTLVEFFAFW